MDDEALRRKYDWRKKASCPSGPGKHDMKVEEITFDFQFWLGSVAV